MFLRFSVEQNVRTLGIVMRYPERQHAGSLQPVGFRSFFFQREIFFDFAADFRSAPRRVRFRRFSERFETHRRIMEMRNRDE